MQELTSRLKNKIPRYLSDIVFLKSYLSFVVELFFLSYVTITVQRLVQFDGTLTRYLATY